MDGRLIIRNQRIETSEKIVSINPATLETIGEACLASEKEANQAIEAAKKAFPLWSSFSFKERGKIFEKAKQVLLKRSEEIAHLISSEQGRPIAEALVTEVFPCLDNLNYYAKYTEKLLKNEIVKYHQALFRNKKGYFRFEPMGISLVISPWNYPFLIPFVEVLAALAAGNTVILRPSSTTPFIGLSIGEIFQEAGIPDGVFNVINSRANIAEHLIQHPDIEIVMFTGSVGIGKRVMQLASQNLTKIVLELGGKDPMIVLKDADIEKAAKGAVWGAFMNAGQSCVAVERVYVEEEIAEKFITKVSEITKNLKTGNPLDSETAIGPLTTKNQLETVEEHVEDAKSKGAKILFGGERINELPGYFYQPTVLTNVNHSMEIMTEETFGLVLPIMKVKNKEEAVKLANDSKYGLSASVWTKNKKIAARIAKKLQAGTITVNDVISYWGEPAGLLTGVKNSGLGRSHGKFGLLELVNIKFISIDSSNRKTQLWWYPYNRKFFEMMKKSLDLFYSHRLNIKMKSLFSLLSHLERIKKGTSIWNLIKNWRKIIF